MSHTTFRSLLTVLLLLYAWRAEASSEGPTAILLSGREGGCGTGFFAEPGLLVTNAHVVRRICPDDSCSEVQLRYASTIGASPTLPIPFRELIIEARSDVLDTAVLRVDPPPSLPSLPLGSSPAPGSSLVAIGFPDCGSLVSVSGEAHRDEAIGISTTLRVRFGQSGSPVMNSDGSVVGMIMQSDSLLGALAARVSDWKMPARIVPINLVRRIIEAPRELSTLEANSLVAFYRQAVLPTESYRRLWNGYLFLTMIEFMGRDMVERSEPPDRLIYIIAGKHPLTFRPSVTQSIPALEELAFLASFERYGMKDESLRPLQLEEITRRLNSATLRNTPLVQEIVTSFDRITWPGFELMWISSLAIAIIIGALVVLTVGLTGGAFFMTARGSCLARSCKTLLFLLCWPLSLWALYLSCRSRASSSP